MQNECAETTNTFYNHPTVGGYTYSFRVQATNSCGVSLQTDGLVLNAGNVPTQPKSVYTVLDFDRDNAICYWDLSEDNGYPIYGQKVYFRIKDGKSINHDSYQIESDQYAVADHFCTENDDFTLSEMSMRRSCTVPLHILRERPF